ncbi:MAG: 50S ribosomal protein L28 [Deltaproteobacteria bacterium]|nr:50S ribosomal protein L28 [Deltaproteobacteria bacterium]MCB9488532.1 50S ribosomal protein L28 [Deltaproteobacteria bacterium]
MARVCEVCGKGRQIGMNVSHSHIRTKKVWQPNLQKIRVLTANGTRKRMLVCTTCISRGFVTKAHSGAFSRPNAG